MAKQKTVNRRFTRLQSDYTDLLNLANRSDYIHVQPVEAEEGWPPEEYIVTFSCRGIARLDSAGEPVAADYHQVSVYLTRDYPGEEPSLKWMTEIWHPNIERKEP